MKIKIVLIPAFCLFLGFACSGKLRKPSGVLSEKKMVELMVDIRLTEAELYRDHNRHYSEDSTRLKTTVMYAELFKKHAISHKDYKKSMKFYVSYPQAMEDILKETANILKTMQKTKNSADSSQNIQ